MWAQKVSYWIETGQMSNGEALLFLGSAIVIVVFVGWLARRRVNKAHRAKQQL